MISFIRPYKVPFGKCHSCGSVESLHQIIFDTGTNKACSVHTIVLCESCVKLLRGVIKE